MYSPRLLNADAVSLPKINLSGNFSWNAGYCPGAAANARALIIQADDIHRGGKRIRRLRPIHRAWSSGASDLPHARCRTSSFATAAPFAPVNCSPTSLPMLHMMTDG